MEEELTLTDWKAINQQKDEEIKELKEKISDLVKKNLMMVKEKSELESRISEMEEVAKNFEAYTNKVQDEIEKIESVWKNKLLDSHRKERALEKMLAEKRKGEIDQKSLSLQSYLKSYKDKIEDLEKKLAKAEELAIRYKKIAEKNKD
ncbi:MAG: hypothetical protein EAX96_08305 [Candidatus Lokiarchaeota archaeon]|nr:hypothetical protein [Candidatus Lokiarchaeota archaeon]